MTMPPSRGHPARASTFSINLLIGLLFALISLAIMLWLGGILAALVTGHRVPHAALLTGLQMLAHPGDPRLAWHSAMPRPIWYWTCTGTVTAAAAARMVRHSLVSADRSWEQCTPSADPRVASPQPATQPPRSLSQLGRAHTTSIHSSSGTHDPIAHYKTRTPPNLSAEPVLGPPSAPAAPRPTLRFGTTPIMPTLVQRIDLTGITMMVQDWGGPIGFTVAHRQP